MKKTPINYLKPAILIIALSSCTQYAGLEHVNEDMIKVDRLEFAGITVHETIEKIESDSELLAIQAVAVAKAQTEAKTQQALYTINKKVRRDKQNEQTAKYISWAFFAITIIAIAMGAVTQGYKRWASVAVLTGTAGLVAMLIPTMVDYLKWALIAIVPAAIFLALSHTKDWSINNRRSRRNERTSKNSGASEKAGD